MKARLYATTTAMRNTASRALALVRRASLASEDIDDAIIVGVADGLDITARDALVMHEFFVRSGFWSAGEVPKATIKDKDSIVGALYGGSNGLRWCERVVEQIRRGA